MMFQKIKGISFQHDGKSTKFSVDCHEHSHGGACFLVSIHLDAVKGPFMLEVITGIGHHPRNQPGAMKKVLIDFIKEHYPNWIIHENADNPGRITLEAPT
jgi:hypothetical protein